MHMWVYIPINTQRYAYSYIYYITFYKYTHIHAYVSK